MLAREYVFVSTDANTRTGKRGKGGGVASIKMLGVYGRDVLNVNGNLYLGFAEDDKLAPPLTTLFWTPKRGVSYTFQSDNHSKGQTRLGYILTKQVDLRLIHVVKVRRPPLEALESDDNLAYAKVRFPCRSERSRR